jgi:hypothetical protein
MVIQINALELSSEDLIVQIKLLNNSTLNGFSLYAAYKIKRVICFYVSITGTWYESVQQLENEYNNERDKHPYLFIKNAIPHCEGDLQIMGTPRNETFWPKPRRSWE